MEMAIYIAIPRSLTTYTSKYLSEMVIFLPMMALRFFLLASLLLFCLAQASSDVKIENEHAQNQVAKGANRRLFAHLDCGALCKARCSAHSRPNVCIRACGTCCARCRCVPPGTSGNREVCGRCYSEMTTHGGRKKCP